MKKEQYQKKQRKIIHVNGVKIANGENSRVQKEKPPQDATADVRSLIWLADKDNLEL